MDRDEIDYFDQIRRCKWRTGSQKQDHVLSPVKLVAAAASFGSGFICATEAGCTILRTLPLYKQEHKNS
jgi:hypothetical protein